VFDKAGVGLSDPVPKVRTLDDRAADVEAVTDAVGFARSVVFGLSDGGFASIVFAATRPERTRALILTGTVTFWGFAGWDDLDRGPAEVRARVLAELGEDYTPSTELLARVHEYRRRPRGLADSRVNSQPKPSSPKPDRSRLRLAKRLARGCGTPIEVWSMSEGDIRFARAGDGESCDRADAAIAARMQRLAGPNTLCRLSSAKSDPWDGGQ
jgi:pimeloyl-ACP methyl ester carboxylesterase